MQHSIVCDVAILPSWLRSAYCMTSGVCVGEICWGSWREESQLKDSSGASSRGLQGASSGLGWIPVPTTLACFSDLPRRNELSSPVSPLQMWMDGCYCSGWLGEGCGDWADADLDFPLGAVAVRCEQKGWGGIASLPCSLLLPSPPPRDRPQARCVD